MNKVGCQEQADPNRVGGRGQPTGEGQCTGEETGVKQRD